MKLALLHTSLVFVSVERLMFDLFAEIMPEVTLINLVDDSLLPEVMQTGHVTTATTQRMYHLAAAGEAAGCDAILSLCSSLGPAIDPIRRLIAIPLLKIDEPMAAQAVARGRRIGVMATVPTTLNPTCALIAAQAAAEGTTIDTTPCLVDGAFGCLMNGEREAHDDRVLAVGARLAAEVDVIVLAQASMTRLATALSERANCAVLTSPRSGIEGARDALERLAGVAV